MAANIALPEQQERKSYSVTTLLFEHRYGLAFTKAAGIMVNSTIVLLVLVLVSAGRQCFASFHTSNNKAGPSQETRNGKKKYIVYMGAKPEAMTSETMVLSSQNMLASFIGSQEEAEASMVYTYKHAFGGFSAWLTTSQAEAISKDAGVVKVFQSRNLRLHTSRSWDFIGFNNTGLDPSFAATPYGPGDVIIGVLDTGIWPESESFNDEGFGPVPTKWKGKCDNSNVVNSSEIIHCNKKLIGAKVYDFQHEGVYHNARDEDGHGTHTSSTAAGRVVKGANMLGFAPGTVKGGMPGARVAMYRICFNSCSDDAILAAFDDAIHDGVDIISLSVGADPVPYDEDSIAIGSFHATAKGIVVSTSAGNSGPDPSTVSNGAPWILTVGASAIDRDIHTVVKLGNGQEVHGSGLNFEEGKPYRIISGTDAAGVNANLTLASSCQPDSLDTQKIKGAILGCTGTDAIFVEPVFNAIGIAGMIFQDDIFAEILVAGFLPQVIVNLDTFQKLLNYMKTSNATATISRTETVNGATAPTVAGFSSRGPYIISPDILKPDVLAPGLNILASWPSNVPVLTTSDGKDVFSNFNIISGTSMACPHASGAAAFVKSLHPDWSPAEIKSALVTTAKPVDNRGSLIKDFNGEVASLFATGSGEISPENAANPGLVYDAGVQDYVTYLCASGYNSTSLKIITGQANITCASGAKANLNYPSITVPKLDGGKFTVTRTVKNVGHATSTYKLGMQEPEGIKMKATPNILKFTSTGQKLSYTVEFEATAGKQVPGQWHSGCIVWFSGSITVRSPIAIRT